MFKTRKNLNSSHGLTLVELLVVTLVMSFISAAAFSMLTAAMEKSRMIENKTDAILGLREAVAKMTRDVRMGRILGDIYGNAVAGTTYNTLTFPGNQNPLYAGGQVPPAGVPFNGWPRWADGSQPNSFTCSNSTLVVQMPIFDPNGFPTGIPPGISNGVGPVTPAIPLSYGIPPAADNVETHIYQVVADPNNPGEWLLQYALIPGYGEPAGTQIGPITLVKGIIGPINPASGQPRVFQYLDKTDATGTAQDAPLTVGEPAPGADINNFSGVILNLEVRRHDASAKIAAGVSAVTNEQGYLNADTKATAIKSEMFMRNNAAGAN